MKQFVIAIVACAALAAPAAAEDDVEEGFSLLNEGARMIMRGLSDQLEPTLKDFSDTVEPALRDLMAQMEPTMQQLLEMVDDLDAYHMPEMLPNGDIILRRKQPAPETPTQDAPPQIDL